jgi:DinB superfamily
MNPNAEPRLAPPGAGLPKPELFIARLIFAIQSRTGNRASFNARFTQEREAIRQLVDSCDPAAAATRVLIARVPGLEDSSRYWSVWMTLDHLRIVNHGIARTIDSLTKEISPTHKASTAAVKPNLSVDSSVREVYEKSCDAVLATASAAPNLKTKARFAHPWFGPLDASGWHAMAASHMAIHRKQIERIINGLSRSDRNRHT